MNFDTSFEAKKLCNLPANPITENWEVGFIDGQLLPHGASYELIKAVSLGDQDGMKAELEKITDQERRERLIKIVERIAPIIGRNV
jgi:hypothetical protein